MLYSRLSLVIYFIHNSVYMSIPVFQFILPSSPRWTSLVAQTVKRPPAMQETRVQSLGREDLLQKEMATHSSILAWKMPWTKEPGSLQSMASQSRTQLSDFTFTFHFPLWYPYLCSLHLHLYFCFANSIICTIFLDSRYVILIYEIN